VPFGYEPIEYEVGKGTLTEIDHNTIQFTHGFLLELDQLDGPVGSPWCLNGACDAVYTYTRLSQPIPCE